MPQQTFNLNFALNPPPLFLGGQGVGGGLNFTAAQPMAQVDQAAQAYQFALNSQNQAYSFEGYAQNIANQYAQPLFTNIVSAEQTLGQGLVQAMQTAANNMNQGCSGFLGCLF